MGMGGITVVASNIARSGERRVRSTAAGLTDGAAALGRALRSPAHRTTALGLVRDLVAPRTRVLAEPPAGSGLRPVLGDADDPVLGSTRHLRGDRAAWGLAKQQRYGELWWSLIAGRRFVQVTGAVGTRQVLLNADKAFSNDGWDAIIGRFFGGGLMLMSFGEHLDHRRIMQSAFSPARLAGYLDGIDRRVLAELDGWRDGRVQLYPTLKDLGLRIATDVFLGMELDARQRSEVLASFGAQARAPLALLRLDLPWTLWGRGRTGYDHVLRFFHDALPAKRADGGDDLFAAMAHATDDDGARFTDDELVRHMNFLWFAAHDTTNLAMTMMGWALAAHPRWQQRAREESAALGDGPLTPADLEQLTALDLVLKEVMRLWPPVPAALRRAVVDTEVAGHHVPTGTWVHVLPVVTHRMPEHFQRPAAFEPERFAPPRSEPHGDRYAYTPFGGGVHKCIGFAFAEMEAKAVFHRLLQTHELSVPNGYSPPMGWGGLPEPLDGLPVTVTRR